MNNWNASNMCSEFVRAGFWARFSAIWIDSLLVSIVTFVVIVLGRLFHKYIPFELTFIILALLYSLIFLSRRGQTLGKIICGLTVRKNDDIAIGFFTAFFREFIGKFVVGIILPIGIAWVIFNHDKSNRLFPIIAFAFVILALIIFLFHYLLKKRTWYDFISRTIVVQNFRSKKRTSLVVGSILIISTGLLAFKSLELISILKIAREMSPYATAKPLHENRDLSSLKEIAALDPSKDSEFVGWLDENGKSPIDYAVEKARQHQVLIFGESHFNRGQVRFLSEIIPRLYHQAGVRCIALEFCSHEDRENINRLINASDYDQELAHQIARNHHWHNWGGKEYWDTFEVVWRLNNSLSEGQQRMRVVGIDRRVDAISWSLAIPGGDYTEGPLWEKLRIIRAFITLPKVYYRDELMAKEVEREIINKGYRGIVWIGSHHSFIRYKQPHQSKGRMAYILHKKFGDKIFQIKLHSDDLSPLVHDSGYNGPKPKMGNFIERIMEARKNHPVGFDVIKSPFMFLRDNATYYYHFQPNVGFGDMASGYIYLELREKFQKCHWIEGFITPKMLAKYKPFYEGQAKRKFRDAKEVDDYFSKER
jgi:uncharacterized RDD family membrane protein YckC